MLMRFGKRSWGDKRANEGKPGQGHSAAGCGCRASNHTLGVRR